MTIPAGRYSTAMHAPVVIAALYRFTPVAEPARLRDRLETLAAGLGLRGTLIVASEGVNGTVAGPRRGIERLREALADLFGPGLVEWKESAADAEPFRRLRVRLKPEIVTMGVPGVDPARRTGAHVPPSGWNALLDDPGTVVVDTRNRYETDIGRFRGALAPGTEGFRDFPGWWRANREAFAGRRVAMYCTGGIRCEKASAWLLGQGVPEVRQLSGGILRYLAEMPERESLWEGECFVFDARVAVGHGGRPGTHTLCHACGRAVSAEGRGSAAHEEGVSCPACIGEFTEADRARFAERQRQIRLAEVAGNRHLASG
jgi:UPF0176 protein